MKNDDKIEPAPSANKSPSKYDKYEFKLDTKYKVVAEDELHETEEVRSQALTQLREWISKDPRIVGCRTDAPFLLRFLRVKKFNVKSTHTLIVRYLTNRQVYPTWFRELDVESPRLHELLDLGVLTPLRKRDELGRQVWIYEIAHMDPDKHVSADFFRLQEIMYQVCVDDEETQITGLVCVFDFSGITMKHVTMFPLLEFKNHTACIMKSIPMRCQAMLVLNLPLVLQAFHDATVMLLSRKLRERFKCIKSLDALKEIVDIDIFPERYGGKESQEELVSEFKRKLFLKRDKIRALDEMTVDLSTEAGKEWATMDTNGNIAPGIVGSFRQLSVD